MRIALLLYPWFELWTLIELGAQTTAIVSIAWVLAGIAIGGMLLRRIGHNCLQIFDHFRDASRLIHDSLIKDLHFILIGVLLMLPGLLSDFIGILLFVKPVRELLFFRLTSKVFEGFRRPQNKPPNGALIEGEFEQQVSDLDTDDPFSNSSGCSEK